jgi:hypothetical protein
MHVAVSSPRKWSSSIAQAPPTFDLLLSQPIGTGKLHVTSRHCGLKHFHQPGTWAAPVIPITLHLAAIDFRCPGFDIGVMGMALVAR